MVDLFARILGWIGHLGPHPQEAILRGTGTWALTLLLVTLGVTPLRRWWNWSELIRARRLLGCWAFAYALSHLLAFWAFEHEFVWAAVWRDAFKRPFVTTGLITFILLLPLAMTSTTWAMRTLGARWKTLHRLIYLAVLSACLHFFLHRAGKNNYGDPALVLGITMLLLGARVWWSYGMRRR